jgi:HSP20 family protein
MLIRFDPFREVDHLMDQITTARTAAARSFPMDAVRRGDRVIVQLDLPGIDPASVDLTAERGTLTIRAERRPEYQDGDEVLVTERPQGAFSRQLLLSDTLDTEALSARYDQGVLTIEVPVAERARPRRIEISRGDAEPAAIDATAAEGDTG